MKKISYLLIVLMAVACTPNTAYKTELKDPELFQSAVKNLSDIIVYDIFSPLWLLGFICTPPLRPMRLWRKPTELYIFSRATQRPNRLSSYCRRGCPELAALYAYNRIGKTLIFSEDKMEAFQAKLEEKVKDMGVPRSYVRPRKPMPTRW